METIEYPVKPVYTLTANDRCDRCGARAYVRVTVTLDKADLLWCGHHAHEIESTLRPIAIDWVDETGAILA